MKNKIVAWHKSVGYAAGIALLLWGFSSLMHPTMTWFGPQALHGFPPTLVATDFDSQNLYRLLQSVPALEQAKVIKLVPGANDVLLQVTRDQSTPRQYFSLASQQELPEQDLLQARWLASYYTGKPEADIEHVEFISEFNDEYPAINRLLPVYRVAFSGDDSLVAFIYTETAALASLSNQFKFVVQWIFEYVHTFKWLDALESGRLIVMGLFMLSLMATAVIGILLLLSFKPRPINQTNRRYHRRLAYIAWLPLLAWSTSGFYHLLQMSLVDTPMGLRLGASFQALDQARWNTSALTQLDGQAINSLSLVQTADQQLFWRASVAPTHALTQPIVLTGSQAIQAKQKHCIYRLLTQTHPVDSPTETWRNRWLCNSQVWRLVM